MDEVTLLIDETNDVVEVAKNIQFYTAVVAFIAAWSYVQDSTIVKCFLWCGVPLITTEQHPFQEEIVNHVINYDEHPLADVKWTEFLDFEDSLAVNDLPRAPE